MNLVRSGALSGYQTLVARYGENPIPLILDAGLSDAQFRNPDTYISYIKMALLLEKTAVQCRAPLFGLVLGGQNGPGVLGELPATVSQEATVGQALAELSRHIYLVARGVQITQVAWGEDVRLQMRFDFDSPLGTEQLLQLSVAHLANIAARLIGVNRFSLHLHLQQGCPENRGLEKTSVKGAPSPVCSFFNATRFDSDFDGVVVPASVLGRKPVIDEEALHYHMHERLRDLQAQYPDSLPSQVRAIIVPLLSAGECSVEAVAGSLDLHPRMLQLRLKAEHTSYKTLLRETRLAIAEESLAHGSMSITDLALNLGFAEVAVFSRCFKAWTGDSPRTWRKKYEAEGRSAR